MKDEFREGGQGRELSKAGPRGGNNRCRVWRNESPDHVRDRAPQNACPDDSGLMMAGSPDNILFEVSDRRVNSSRAACGPLRTACLEPRFGFVLYRSFIARWS